MASEKKPSIYYDRGTIGSSDELDEYGVWVKSEPQDLSSVSGETRELVLDDLDMPDMADLPDFDTDSGTVPEDAPAGSGEDLEDNLTFDMVSDLMEESPAEDLELPDIDIPAEAPAVTEEEAEEGFDEISMEELIGEREEESLVSLSSGAGETMVPESVEEAAPAYKDSDVKETDLSTQLLMKIANELSSIRTELSTLKQELAGLKEGERTEGEEGDAQSRGFFGEEDDEKIALTGDELDNILNTADFTEEAGADATQGLQDDFSSLEAEDDSSSGPFQDLEEVSLEEEEEGGLLSGLEDIIAEEPEAPGEEGPAPEEAAEEEAAPEAEEMSAEEPISFEAPPEGDLEEELLEDFSADFQMDNLDDSGEEGDLIAPDEEDETAEELPDFSFEDSGLGQILEEGAMPMTPAPEPEDADFLEEDPLAVSAVEEAVSPEEADLSLDVDLDLEEADLSLDADLPLEEADLSLDVDLPLEEADLSLDADLPVEETGLSLTEDFSPGEPDTAPEVEEALDLTGAVIDEPDLSEDIKENPLQEPSLEDISIDLDLEDDFPEIGGEMEEEAEDEAAGDEDEAIEISAESFQDAAGGESESPEDLALIPEGFVVDSEVAEAPLAAESEGEDEELESAEILETAEPESRAIPSHLKQELKTVLSYMDHLLESLPDDKIEEFARSEYFGTYKKLFKELGLV